MRKIVFVIFLGIGLLAVSSCKKEDVVSAVPSIQFVSISPNPAVKYVDDIKITIKYSDGDGDLGENAPDVKNAFITDSRNNVIFKFRIPQQAPDSSNISIEGTLDFNLPPQGFVDDNNTTEAATYSVYIVDRAGHTSNTVQTSALTINK